ncbi:MAG: MarR family winged helix-turn-helix transcriptional regulator [Solirubrobacteraceae bacterium]
MVKFTELMPGRHAHRETEAAQALVAVAPLAARWIARLLAAHEPPLTTPQYLALRAIAREQVTVNELARRAGVSGPAASQLLNALADAGLLDRHAAEDDRRRQELALSAQGRQALDSAEALLSGRMASLIGDLPGPEIDALARVLPRVEAALSGAAPPRRPPPPPRPPHPPHERPPRPPRPGP